MTSVGGGRERDKPDDDAHLRSGSAISSPRGARYGGDGSASSLGDLQPSAAAVGFAGPRLPAIRFVHRGSDVCSIDMGPPTQQSRHPETVADLGHRLVGVYNYSRLLYVISRSASNHRPQPYPRGISIVPLSAGAGLGSIFTTPGRKRKRSSLAGRDTEGASTNRPVRRLQHPEQPCHGYPLPGAGGVSKEDQLSYVERTFLELVESADVDTERHLVEFIQNMRRNDSQAYEEWAELSDPSSESDDLSGDPDYDPDEADGNGDGYNGGGQGGGGGGGSDGGSSGSDGDDSSSDDDEDDSSGDDDEDDAEYLPDVEDEHDDDEEYMEMVAAQPPLPEGVHTEDGVTYVENIDAIRKLVPEVHILGFSPELNLEQRIKLWKRGDKRGFDFHPTEMLRWVWRMELLLDGRNPGNPGDAPNEPPVPNPGDYEAGW